MRGCPEKPVQPLSILASRRLTRTWHRGSSPLPSGSLSPLRCWLLLSLLFLVACRPATDSKTLAGWGLPADLPDHLGQLELIRLPESVDRLDWLPKDGRLRILLAAKTKVRNLRGLPSTVSTLDLSYTRVTDLGDLPESLVFLDITNTGVTDLSKIPDTLTSLAVGGTQIKSLQGLPSSLKSLTVTGADLQTLKGLPNNLESLKLEGLRLTQVNRLPSSLISLRLSAMPLKELRALPESLQSLEVLISTDNQISLENLPPLLSHLTIDSNYVPDIAPLLYLKNIDLMRVREIPGDLPEAKGLRTLRLNDMPGGLLGELIQKIPPDLQELGVLNGGTLDLKLLPQVATLDITNCKNPDLRELPGSVKTLNASWCELTSLRGVPDSLLILNISNTTKLAALDVVPSGLQVLTASGSKLTRLPVLPASLRVLDLTASSNISQLDSLPAQLEWLSVSQTGVDRLPPLPDTLQYLDISNSRISSIAKWPGKLEVLILSPGQLKTLSKLPKSVRALEFRDL